MVNKTWEILVVAGLAALVAAGLAGCAADAGGRTSVSPTFTPTPSPTPQCRVRGEATRWAGPELSALVNVQITNTGNAECVVAGYPAAQYLTAAGSDLPIGDVVQDQDPRYPATPVTIAPGASAYELVTLPPQAVSTEPCTATQVSKIRLRFASLPIPIDVSLSGIAKCATTGTLDTVGVSAIQAKPFNADDMGASGG